MERGELTRVNRKARYFGQQELQVVQDLDVLVAKVFFLFCTLLRVLRQGISSFVSLALMIVYSEMVTKKFLGLADLPGAPTLRVYEPAEVVVVSEYEHLMLKALEIVSPDLESLNNG